MPDCHLLTAKHVCRQLNISLPTLYRLRKADPDFPRPVTLSRGSVRYRQEDVGRYIALKLSFNDRSG